MKAKTFVKLIETIVGVNFLLTAHLFLALDRFSIINCLMSVGYFIFGLLVIGGLLEKYLNKKYGKKWQEEEM
ncbi:MAG: hypothetical protein QW228_09345 [Candidatus Aenigmatarchaeota archaeon]